MRKPVSFNEIFLHPGEYCWGDKNTRVRTILGSCVTLTTWHPTLLVGGMTHIIMPKRTGARDESTLNARYAEDAITLLIQDMKRYKVDLNEFQLKLFGGGDMFSSPEDTKENAHLHIGKKNIDATRKIIKGLKLDLHATHVGGLGHRSIFFDIWSGYVWVKYKDQRGR